MSNNEILLFNKDKLSFVDRFYLLMNLLVSNQTNSRLDSILFLGIFFLQIITGFFSDDIAVFNKQRSTSDKILNYIVRILRVKDLFIGSYTTYKVCLFIIIGVVFVFTIFFFYVCSKTTKLSFYTFQESLLNFYTKTYIYIGFNIILDMTFSSICFEPSGKNPYWPEASCQIKDIMSVFLVGIILVIWSIVFVMFIQFFYCDSLYLSTSFYAKISCNYEIISSLNGVFFSVLLSQAKYIGKEVFLIYNLCSSVFLFNFYIRRYLFYDRITNITAGLFHALYAWTSLFFLIFAYIDVSEKGIIYLTSSCIVLYFYFNIKFRVEESILLSTPFYQIKNQYYILYYIKNLIDKINHFEESPEEKAMLIGIMQMHAVECPNPTCVSKLKTPIYLPLTNEWSDRQKPLISDKVYLMNFIILVMNFFIGHNYYSPNMVINMSLYFLEIIGNFCQAMFYYKKVKEMKLSIQEYFSFVRLRLKISQALVEKLKAANEPCYSLEDLNVTMYFKYEDLSKTFFDEMNNDVNLSLDFWKTFRNCLTDSNQSIDFNKIFHLTDKIRLTKSKVEKLWNKLIKIFNGVNDLFELYLQYVEQINDDDLLKRNLEEVKRKNENFADHIQQNFYSHLFSKDTGIIIANGDKGKEGIIEKANSEIEAIFRYKPEEIKGMNLSNLMPRLFAKHHKGFVEKYYDIGEKKVIDHKDFKTFGKDKENSILMLKLAIKLFPMLNECVYFVGLIFKENIDDIIFIDSKFNIQGMSIKLMRILQLQNKLLFQDNDIPFYVICKKFVNFYKIFLQGKRQGIKDVTKHSDSLLVDDVNENVQNENDNNDKENKDKEQKNDFHENVEINENIELEYEIRLPKFLIDYSNTIAQREQKTTNNLFRTNSEITDNHQDEDDALIKDDNIIGDEGQTTLMGTSNITPGVTPQEKAVTPMQGESSVTSTKKGKRTKITIDGEESEKIDFNKPDEEKEFETKVTKYRELFESGKFNELEDYIDQCTKNSPGNEFKFNFTFDRYKYGEKQMAYVVRCIDNKNELGDGDDESVGDVNAFAKSSKYKKEKAAAIKNLIELYEEEKHFILTQQENFIQLSLEDKHFQTILEQCKEDMNKMSIIHGRKKESMLEDENSSQSSQTGFNADLCKKNRIEEIRANIMSNISSFFALKYIKVLVLGVGVITCVFCSLYLIFFDWLYQDLMIVCNLNSQLYQTSLWISNIVSMLISLRTYYRFVYNNDTGYGFNSFIEDKTEYFTKMKAYGFDWYNQTIKTFGVIENQIERYISNNDTSFWGRHNISYKSFYVPDKEGFPLGIGQVLSDINSLLRNKNFSSLAPQLEPSDKNFLLYTTFLSIENAYDNLIPTQFHKLKIIPQIFQDFNRSSINILLISLLMYCCIMAVFCIIYDVFLYSTNKNMGIGLLKVTKIKIEKIEDTIKRIEGFNSLLRKYRDRDNDKYKQYDENGKKREAETTQAVKVNSISDSSVSSSISSGFGGDAKKHKELKILAYSYYQTLVMLVLLCAMLIPMYVITYQMVNSTNQLIDVENYLFGRILMTSASTVKVKCMMSQCDVKTSLDYDSLVNKSSLQNIVQGISIFKELSTFYNEKFLANACETAFDPISQGELFTECMNDVLVQSANNTDSLLKLIDETIENIYKEQQMQSGDVVMLDNGTEMMFNTLMLFNTSAFNNMENVYYKYIAPTSGRLSYVFQNSLKVYLNEKWIVVMILVVLFGVIIFGICGYIGFAFVNKLVHLLSVSRCIFRIIPTTVIISTPDLVNWIENIY